MKISKTDSGYENDGFEKDLMTYKESKPTLNEEIEMSSKGIDYVNSLEVKEEKVFKFNHKGNELSVIGNSDMSREDAISGLKNYMSEFMYKYKEHQRIRKQALNAWICVTVIIIIVVLITNWE